MPGSSHLGDPIMKVPSDALSLEYESVTLVRVI